MSVLVVLKTCQMLVLICSSILLASFVKGVDVMLCAIVILSLSLSLSLYFWLVDVILARLWLSLF